MSQRKWEQVNRPPWARAQKARLEEGHVAQVRSYEQWKKMEEQRQWWQQWQDDRKWKWDLGQELLGLLQLELSWLVMEKPVVAGAYRPATLEKLASQQQLGRGQGPKHLDHGSCPRGHGPAALAHLDPLELSAAKAHHHGLGQADCRTHVVKNLRAIL